MKLSIILLNYKKKELTSACINALYVQYQKKFEKNEFEVIVIDNLSKDGSVEFLKKEIQKKKLKNIFLQVNSENAGFSKGCNIGASYAKGEYLLFLNNDTKVLDTGLVSMIDFMESRPHVGILGGKMVNQNQTLQRSSGKFYTLFQTALLLMGLERFGLLSTNPKKIEKTDWVSGGCMMIRKSLFEKIHGFDPNIFMYVEDVDICLRVKKTGFFTYYYPFVSIVHIGHATSSRRYAIVHIYEGLMYLYKKHMPAWQVWVLQCILKMKATILIVVGKVLHKNNLAKTYEEALNVLR